MSREFLSRYERKKREKRRKLLSLLISAFIIILILTLCIGLKDSCSDSSQENQGSQDNTTAAEEVQQTEAKLQSSAVGTETTTEYVTEASATETEALSYPEELEDYLAANGSSIDTLSALGCSQLVVVDSSGTSATIRFFESDGDGFAENESLFCYGYVGSMGTVYEMSEQISGTPKGLYPIGEAFYINSEPQTGLDVFEVTYDTYWVDDPDSQFYNQRVEGTAEKDWDSAEHMIEYGYNYNYGFVINYNMPAEYNKGSAIFFHVGNSPTQGCVATSEDMVIAYLYQLSKYSNPYILVI